jgi:hypothetical protein
VGGNGAVQAAIIINWTPTGQPTMSAAAWELYTLDRSGMPRLAHSELRDIFLLIIIVL